ncbi:hypothetical protein TWF481_005170 [Arthrobotrys musiformis]|uniref:Uncharacterized protein n=1 Tax=Arthrobotrys musiformis TaxID=47236 RepID=A0AAV9WCX1_9PEZI
MDNLSDAAATAASIEDGAGFNRIRKLEGNNDPNTKPMKEGGGAGPDKPHAMRCQQFMFFIPLCGETSRGVERSYISENKYES